MSLWSHVRDVWKSPRVTVIRIEVLVEVCVLLLWFLVVAGSCRRWSKHWFVQKGVLGAYITAFSIGTYTVGSMQSSTVKSDMYPVWAVSFLVLFGCANSIIAYGLDDHNRVGRQLYQLLLYVVYVLLIASNISGALGAGTIIVLCLIAYVKVLHRLYASRLATNSWILNKVVADHMNREHGLSEHYDAASMEGYQYLVDWPLDKVGTDERESYVTKFNEPAADEVITIDKIWKSDGAKTMRDVCLSFSLFHLLKRRFFGFCCGESTRQKTRDFVFKGLLSKDDYERPFKVIEVELGFLYDFFFTKYAFLYYESRGAMYCSVTSMAGIVVVAVLASMRAIWEGPNSAGGFKRKIGSVVLVNTTTADIVITLLILMSVFLAEVLQPLFFWTSDWGRVAFACECLRQDAAAKNSKYSTWYMRLKAFLTSRDSLFHNYYYWQNKLGQYSLIDQVYRRNSTTNGWLTIDSLRSCLSMLYGVPNTQVIRMLISPEVWQRGQAGDPVKLPAVVKKAVLQSLERSNGRLKNAASSLEPNGAHLKWACAQDTHSCSGKDTQTQVILRWHVATCYCECERATSSDDHRLQEQQDHQVATKLSKYCAYLVFSAPTLLPGYHFDTVCLLGTVVKEAQEVLAKRSSDKYEAMKALDVTTDNGTIFRSGVKLGKQLEEMNPTDRWKVMADFWACMMLYIAPSDNVKEHIERLAHGGEFITHLWALLFHAGILKSEDDRVGNDAV